MSSINQQEGKWVVLILMVVIMLAPAVCSTTYVNKAVGGQYLWNVLGLYRDSGSTPYVLSSCSAGYAIRSIGGDGTPVCEYDDLGGLMSYWYLYGDGGTTQQVDDAETAYILGSTDGIDTSVGATNAVTVTFDGSELPADDITESKVYFNTCTGDNKLTASDGNLACTGETDPKVVNIGSGSVCYGTASGIDCNEGYSFFWDSTAKKLGINTGSAPTQKVQVAGTGNERVYVWTNDGQIPELNLGISGTYYNIYNAGNDAYKLKFWSGGDRVTFTANGQVGINTTTPSGTMEVRYSGSTYAYMCIPNNGYMYGIWGGTSAGIGVQGIGGINGDGVRGIGNQYGVIGNASASLYATGYGVYGTASGGTRNWGGYFTYMGVADDLRVGYINYKSSDNSSVSIGSPVYSYNSNNGFTVYGGTNLSYTGSNYNDNNIVRVPTFSSSASACTATLEGDFYWNDSGSPSFYYCVGGSWRHEYTPAVLDSGGGSIGLVGDKLNQRDGLAEVYLPGYGIDSNFSFYLSNSYDEREFYDAAYLNMRCYYGDGSMRHVSYPLADSSEDYALLAEDDDTFLVLNKDERSGLVFARPKSEDAASCDSVEFELVISGHYEQRYV